MKKYRIPTKNKDLKQYAVWKNLKCLIFFVIYEAFFCLAFVVYYNRRHEDADPLKWWVYPIFTAVILVSGWIICCMSRFVFDRNLSGRIEDIKYTRDYGRGLSRKATFLMDFHTYIKITVVTDKGKRRRVKVPLFEDGYDGYYEMGGTLIKFRGLNYPLCLESEAKGTHMCAVCGVRTYYLEGKMIHGEAEPEIVDGSVLCRCCRHTIIDAEQIK